MKVVANYSGGLSSHLAAHRMIEEYGRDEVVLLFADTKSEDEDLYRFIAEGAEALGSELVRIADGRDIWQVMKDERFLANSRVDPCSKILKRRTLNQWRECHAPSATTCVGYTACETGRLDRMRKFMPNVRAPLMEPPSISKHEVMEEFFELFPGIKPPRLYSLGLEHNNCGGGCVKAGHKHWKMLLEVFPERYSEWELNEQDVRDHLGKDVSILRDRRGGTTRTMTLREFRERIECDMPLPLFESSIGCMC